MKVYEYLATGRPVLSTPMAGLEKEDAGKWVQFATPAMFGEGLAGMMKSKIISEINQEQILAANAFSWGNHFRSLSGRIKELE